MARWLFLIAGCGGGEPTAPPDPGCTDASLTWSNAGDPFVTAWCAPCHSAGLTGARRLGAPAGLDFDTLAQVQANAERIGVRAVPADATMPPASAAPAADRARFGAWLDCGAPGVEEPAEAPCAGESVGGWVASTDGVPCPAVTEIAGTLIADVAVADGYACLCTVDELVVTGAAEVTLSGVTALGGLDLSGATGLSRLHLPAVAVLDALVAEDLPALAVVALPELDAVGTVRLAALPVLTDLRLDRLTVVTGDLLLRDAPSLVSLAPLEALEQVGGDVVLTHLGIAGDPLLRRLVSVGGSLELSAHLDWVALDGLDRLALVGGDLLLHDNPVLAALSGPDGPTEVGGDVVVAGNPALPVGAVSDWQAGLTVQGEIRVEP